MWELSCWDCGFESRLWHGCLSLEIVVCCQVEISATDRSLAQRSPTECAVSGCDQCHNNRLQLQLANIKWSGLKIKEGKKLIRKERKKERKEERREERRKERREERRKDRKKERKN